jgi:undecaprenyl-diphosphatase
MEVLFRKSHIKGILIAVLLFTLLAISYPYVREIDQSLTYYIYDFTGVSIDKFFMLMTTLGSAYISFPLLGLLVFFFLIQKNMWVIFALVFNLVGVRLLNSSLKSFFNYERPEWQHLVEVGVHTFPSGHAMNTLAFFGFLGYLIYYHNALKKKWSNLIVFLISLFIFLVGLSRVYLGVHYLMDVIAGFIGGGFWLFATIILYRFKRS